MPFCRPASDVTALKGTQSNDSSQEGHFVLSWSTKWPWGNGWRVYYNGCPLSELMVIAKIISPKLLVSLRRRTPMVHVGMCAPLKRGVCRVRNHLHTDTTILHPFLGLPGWAGARRNLFWTLWCKGRNRLVHLNWFGRFGCTCRRTDLGIVRELDPTKKDASKNFRSVIVCSFLLRSIHIHCVPKKLDHQTHGSNFVKS